MSSPFASSRVVWEYHHKLNMLGENNKVSLIPGHQDTVGVLGYQDIEKIDRANLLKIIKYYVQMGASI